MKSKIDRIAILAVVAGVLLFTGLLVWTNNPGKGQASEWEEVVVCLDEKEITEKEVDNWERETQLIGKEGIYFLEYSDENKQMSLYYKENDKQEKELLENGIESFLLNEDETKLLCTKTSIKPYALGFEIDYGIIEIDLKENTSRIWIDFDDEYVVPRSLSDEGLYYVELSFDKQKSKVFYLDFQTNKKKCIYRTNQKVVGVIKESE